MFTTLLLFHSLISVALLGAITHQAVAVAAQRVEARATTSFIGRFRRTDPAAYSSAIVVLIVVVILTGAIMYPNYRTIVRPALQSMDLRAANGAFEIKEHLSAIGLVLLPAYWAAWRQPLVPEYAAARIGLTWILASMVWWNFLVGQFLVTIKSPF
jgi:hypothetical protein